MASWQNESNLTEMTVLSTIPASTGMIVLFRTVLVVQARNKYMMLAYSSVNNRLWLAVYTITLV